MTVIIGMNENACQIGEIKLRDVIRKIARLPAIFTGVHKKNVGGMEA